MAVSAQPAGGSPGAGGSAIPDPQFAILAARSLRHAAVPMMSLDLGVSEPNGRPMWMIALSVSLMIEPARRRYDEATRERLLELFGPPERWAVSTHSLLWSTCDVLVPAFTDTTVVPLPVPCSFDMEIAAVKYLHALADGEAPLAVHFNGTIYYPGDDGQMQMTLVPWSTSIDYRLEMALWRQTVEHYYPNTAWVPVHTETLAALQRAKLARGAPTLDACVRGLLESRDG
jgi:hypothetical protein